MNNEFYCVGNRMIWKIDRNNEFGIIKQCENYIIINNYIFIRYLNIID